MTLKEKIEFAVSKGYSIDNNGNAVGPKGLLKLSGVNYYLYFGVNNPDRTRLRVSVHKLQAYQKFGDRVFEDGVVVRHADGNKHNNHWSNIEVGSQSDNMMDRCPIKRQEHSLKAAIHLRRFNDEQVKEIRDFHKSCESYKKTKERFGISSSGTLHSILNNAYKTKL